MGNNYRKYIYCVNVLYDETRYYNKFVLFFHGAVVGDMVTTADQM